MYIPGRGEVDPVKKKKSRLRMRITDISFKGYRQLVKKNIVTEDEVEEVVWAMHRSLRKSVRRIRGRGS